MTADELFEQISKLHAGEISASVGYDLEPNPCPSWLWRLEWMDRCTLSMIDFYLVKEQGLSPAIYSNLTPYAEENTIATHYNKWRPLRPELGSYYSNHWFLEWTSPKTETAYQLHLLTAPRDSDIWIHSNFELDIYLTWGIEDLEGEDCHFISPSLPHWRILMDRICMIDNGIIGS